MLQHTDDAMIKEIFWENHQIDEGVRKYRESTETKTADSTSGGSKLLQIAMPQVIDGIKAAYVEAEETLLSNKGGQTSNWLFMIGLVSAEQAAVISINKALEYTQTDKGVMTMTKLAQAIGQGLNQQLQFENWKKNSKSEAISEGHKKSFAELLLERAKGDVTRPKLARWRKKYDNYVNIDWGDDEIIIGNKMLEILITSIPEIFQYKMKMIKGKSQRLFTLTEEAKATYDASEEFAELQRPFLLPTLIEPLEWHYDEGKLRGGYHHIKRPLFTSGISKHTAGDYSAPSDRFLASVNNVQMTPWKINPYICMVVDMVYGTGKTLGGIPQECSDVAPKMSEEEYNAMTPEVRKAYHVARQDVVERIATAQGRHSSFARKLSIAHKLLEHERFFFPHFADFRGRLYPMPQELTPQGDHVAKGLLMFAEGKELGADGMYWLKVHIANTFGKDKDTLDDRVAWTDEQLANGSLEETTSNPMECTLWNEADEPLTFLAACKELVQAYELEDPLTFKSHIAVAMDGTCNGMQLLSLLGRDVVGAEKTNCRSVNSRFDLYSEVASKVLEICESEKSSNQVAAEWFRRLNGNPGKARKVVKRAVMTTPYGVTGRGIATQLVNDRHCHDMGVSRTEAGDYMKNAILEAMSEVNGKAVEIMAYFQNVAGLLAKQQVALQWYTPMGLKVTQAYFQLCSRRIHTVFGTVQLWEEHKEMGLDQKKNFQSAAPNVIHSFDAAMLQLTVEKMAGKGHTGFAMIHDSYGMHAANIEDMHITLRESAHEIFSVDCLAEFHEYAQAMSEEQLPDVPTPGEYDLNEIRTAPYFFS